MIGVPDLVPNPSCLECSSNETLVGLGHADPTLAPYATILSIASQQRLFLPARRPSSGFIDASSWLRLLPLSTILVSWQLVATISLCPRPLAAFWADSLKKF